MAAYLSLAPTIDHLRSTSITSTGKPRETRDWWTLLTVETEVNGDSKSTNERGPSLASSCRYKRLLLFSSPYNLCVPIAQQPGQAVVQGRLFSECVSPGKPLPITQRKEEREVGWWPFWLYLLAGGGGGKGGRRLGATSNEGAMSVGFFSTTIIQK